MVKQKKRTRITQSGKNCAINCAIEGARLIWKQKISLVLTKPYCSLANHNPEFRCVICTVLHIFALVLDILHSFLSQSELSNFFVYFIRDITIIPDHFTRSICPPPLASRVNACSYDPESCNKTKLIALQATIQRLRAWFKLLLLIICRAFVTAKT